MGIGQRAEALGKALVVAMGAAAATLGVFVPTTTFADKRADASQGYVARGVREERVTATALLAQDETTHVWTLTVSAENTSDAPVKCAIAFGVARKDSVLVGRVMGEGEPIWGTTRARTLAPSETARFSVPAPAAIVRQIEIAERIRAQLNERLNKAPPADDRALMQLYRTPVASYDGAIQRIVRL